MKENKAAMSDDELRIVIEKQFGIAAIEVCNEIREKQDSIVRKVKEVDGVTIRQIARLTGLSQTRVWRA